MRLTRLELHNFRCFTDLSIRLDPATVIIGANDAGKSTLLDAARCLLSNLDRNGEPFERRTVASMRDLFFFLTYDEGEAELLPTEPVTIVGTFGDLSRSERDAWDPVVVDDEFQIGVYFPPYGSQEGRIGRQGPRYVLPEGHRYRTPSFRGGTDSLGYEFAPGVHQDVSMLGRRWVSMTGPVLGRLPELVTLPGPDHAPAGPGTYLAPILTQTAAHALSLLQDEVLSGLMGAVEESKARAVRVLARIVPDYVEQASGAEIWSDPLIGPEGMSDEAIARLTKHLLGEIDVVIRRRLPGSADPREEVTGVLGAGARRAVALASLELFRDSDLWPQDRPVLVLLEEPEVGLHPSAQRRVAASLRQLPTHGVQTVVVTHSPAILNAAAPSGVRIATGPRGPGHSFEVLEPAGLQEILEAVGASPADLLLGERFVIVEGESDVAAMRVWARRLGYDLEAQGVRFVAAGTYSMAGMAAKLVDIAYGPVSVHVLLDGGSDTAKETRKITRALGKRVSIDRLELPEIEMYFSWDAVATWLIAKGAQADRIDTALRDHRGSLVSKSKLNLMHMSEFRRPYAVVDGARAIAGFMTPAEIAPFRKHLVLIFGGEPLGAQDGHPGK